ncbi:MAG: galactose-1-phosphate uridylyltransferase [Bacteroidetes bacterium]|nr:galactose-1-phosphate uridylyltransferase [Bacteroidota bacterium]
MSELRQDPVTKDWVIIATERARRPNVFAQVEMARGTRALLPEHLDTCPFCRGNESQTPPAVLSYSDGPEGTAWMLRVVPNKFPALTEEGSTTRSIEGGFFRHMDGVGWHEVVIQSPIHNRTIALMNDHEVELTLRAYNERYHAVKADPRVRLIIIFKNHGPAAGTSLDHPHSQIVATPIAPSHIRDRLGVAMRYYDDTGECIYRSMVDAELRVGERVIEETPFFVVFHPFASRSPFETWIVPKRSCASFSKISKEELKALAPVLRRALLRLYVGLNDPDFNLIVNTAPVDDEDKQYYMWHIQIIPRLTTVAGFEMGSGIYISTALPEQTAEFMRKLGVQ